jgi:nucleoside-diphosphate-sugar epimerase
VRIFVTGASSFTGAPLVRRLIADGYKVRAPDHQECDIRNPYAVARAVDGCDAVIHAAYAPVSSSPREVMDTAVNGMTSVLRACELHGVQDLMLVSSPRVEDRYVPGSLTACYGAGKMASELMAAAWLASGVFRRVVIARVYNAYGPDMGEDHVIPQFTLQMMITSTVDDARCLFPVKGSGADIRSFIHVDDCAVQLATLFRHGSPGVSHYDVGVADEPVTVTGLARAVADCFGREITVVPGQADAVPTVRVPHLPALLTALPHRPFREGLRQTVAWYQEREEEFCGRPV